MLRSLVEGGGYDESDFCRRMDEEIFPLLNGLPVNGPGGYTQQSIRDAWRKRVQQNMPWGQIGGQADTTEAISRTLALAVLYAFQPQKLAAAISSNARLTQIDDTVVTLTVAYGAVLGLLVQGHKLNKSLSGKLMRLAKAGKLPFHTLTHTDMEPPQTDNPRRSGYFASPDALLTPSYVASAAMDPDIRIEPAWKVSIVYGMTCAIYHQLPAAYHLTARFPNDFESAVLHAVNGGGENQARATLTGALVGGQVGLSGIPQRFLDGLDEGETLQGLAIDLASKVDASGAAGES
jgi:ADP-ribosylglycohydrolase